MKRILLTISALLAFGTAFSQGQSLWLGDTNVKKGVIKDLGDGSQAVAAFNESWNRGLALIDMTLTSYTFYTAAGIELDPGQNVSDIAVADEEIFFCGFDSANNCAYIGHTTENDINFTYTYKIIDITQVWTFVEMVAYRNPGSTTKYTIVAYGYDRNGQDLYIVEAIYDKSLLDFDYNYTYYSDNLLNMRSMNLLTTDDYVVFIYRDFINNYDYYIARCPKSTPLSYIEIYRIQGSDILDRQGISATSLDRNNIAISYYASDIYQNQVDIHCIDVSTMSEYNYQAFPVIEKCAPPQMTYLSTPNVVVMLLEYIYPDNPPAPSNVLYGYPSFVYIDLNQSSSYVTYWLYSDKQYRFSGLTNFSGKWFMGTTYADHWYLERHTTPPIPSCLYNSTVRVAIPANVRISYIINRSGQPYSGTTDRSGSPYGFQITDECITP